MHKSIIISLLTVVMVSLGGCGGVSESDHQAVISERDTLKRELGSVEKNIASLKAENDSLRNELEKQKQEVARLMARAASRQVETKQAKSKETPRFYQVKSGDSLWIISRRYQIPVATLQKLNNLQNSNLKIGQKILLR
jgi:peptidoglycan endopeptidase LytE